MTLLRSPKAIRTRSARNSGLLRAGVGLDADGHRLVRPQIIEVFATRGELRDGLDPSLALDLLFGTNRAETYLAFTRECGWSMPRYKAWQFATLARQILPAAIAQDALARGSAEVTDM